MSVFLQKCPLGSKCPGSGRHRSNSEAMRDCTRKAQQGDMTSSSTGTVDISSFVSEDHGGRERNASVLSPEFTDVLIDRYGDDVREVDKERNELSMKVHVARNRYNNYRNYLDKHMTPNSFGYEEYRDKADKAEAEYFAAANELNDYNAENPVEWPQYWLVTNGHFHKDLECFTLRDTTMVGMYDKASGMNQDEAIELAGSRVCTHCVPDAPVDILDRPSHVWTEEEKKAQEEKDRREKERAEKEAEKKRKKEEREARAAAKQAELDSDDKHNLPQPIPVPQMNFGVMGDPVTEVENIVDLRNHLKDSYIYAVIDWKGLKNADSWEEEDLNHEISAMREYYSKGVSEERKDIREKNIRDHYGKDSFWVVAAANGDIDEMEERIRGVHDGVKALADQNGHTFERTMKNLYGKRMMTTLKNHSSHFHIRQMARNNIDYYDRMNAHAELFRGWIENPDSFRDYVDS